MFKTNVKLTSKELVIIQLICKELTAAEIALITKLRPATIENYRRKIQQKIGAKNVVGIAIYAFVNGLIESGEKWSDNMRSADSQSGCDN